jgi:hypothetical protein
MRKKLIQRAVEERRKMDRRKKLSKTIQPSAGRNMLHQRSEPTGSPSWKMQPTERSQLKASRGLSPPRNFEDLRQVPSARAADASRAGWFLSNNGAYRPTSSTSLMVKGPPETSKPLSQLTSMSDIGQRSSHMVWFSLLLHCFILFSEELVYIFEIVHINGCISFMVMHSWYISIKWIFTGWESSHCYWPVAITWFRKI